MASSGQPYRKVPAARGTKSPGGGRKGLPSKKGRKPAGKRGTAKAVSARGKLLRLPLLGAWIAAVIILAALIYFSGAGGHGRNQSTEGRETRHQASAQKKPVEPQAAPNGRNLAAPAQLQHQDEHRSQQKSPDPGLPTGPVLQPKPVFSSKELPSDPLPSPNLLALNRPAPTPPLPAPPAEPVLARVAIVIDDFGPDVEAAKKFLSLPFPVTFSVLPHQPHSAEIADLAHSRGREVILHLPMEPRGYPKIDPGRGALLLSLSDDATKRAVSAALDASPHFRGVNNHMGSRMTENAQSMKLVLGELNRRGLFFLDSATSSRSKAWSIAMELKMPGGKRDIFLDHNMSADSIRSQVDRLIRTARVKGSAIAIGHPHETTLRALREASAQFAKNGIKIVPASELMSVPR